MTHKACAQCVESVDANFHKEPIEEDENPLEDEIRDVGGDNIEWEHIVIDECE